MKKTRNILRTAYVTICMSIALSGYAHAYLDPSIMTYAIQVVAGIIVAVGAVVGILWRKAKKKVRDKLGIDENAKKEIEADVVEFQEEPKEP